MNGFMKLLLTVVILVGLGMGAYQLWEYWGKFRRSDSSSGQSSPAAAPIVSDSSLPGLPPKLEPYLENARQRGAQGLHDFLLTYGRTIADPRLGNIELDYVVLVAKDNPTEARKVFARVKSRTSPTSPIYPRIQLLEKTYE
jgi:hypothetical protein